MGPRPLVFSVRWVPALQPAVEEKRVGISTHSSGQRHGHDPIKQHDELGSAAIAKMRPDQVAEKQWRTPDIQCREAVEHRLKAY